MEVVKSKFALCHLLFFVCLLTSCNSIKRNCTNEIINDTIVCKEKVQDNLTKYCTYEYFIINKGDTSAYSFVFRFNRTHPHDCNMEILNWPDYKRYLIPKDTKISCYVPNYNEFLKELDLCLNAALNEKDSINLKRISFRLVCCSDIAIQTSNSFYKMGSSITHKNIEEALQTISLKEDFNLILEKYNLHVANVACHEEIYIVTKSEFLNNSNSSNTTEIPDSVLDVDVCIYVAH